jgi:dTDP-4-amino-4,6-dideoxygalactose transaminase
MIPYGNHSINQDDIDAVVDVLRGDWLTTGPYVEKFESDLQKFTGGVPVVSVSSGTAALHSAYIAAGISPGDEVITPPLTFIATQSAAALCGAKIIFSDIQTDTGNLDPSKIIEKITSKTKAIVAVDYAGHPAELYEISKICDNYNLIFIEDAAHSFGSKYKDRYVGSIADITTFSFFPTKNITTGEGGAIACKDPQMLQRVKRFARQGLVRNPLEFIIKSEGPWHQEVHEFGLNYRLPDILAALGSSQLNRFQEFKSRRKQIWDRYNSAFENFQELTLPTKQFYVDPFWHLYSLRVPANLRLSLFNFLRSRSINVQVNYFPTHLQPIFSNPKIYKNLENAEAFYHSEISLPIYFGLTDDNQEHVINTISDYMYNYVENKLPKY